MNAQTALNRLRALPPTTHQQIKKKYHCDDVDAATVQSLLDQAAQAGAARLYGPAARIEEHELFEDDAGLDLATLETALILNEGTLLRAYRQAYRAALPKSN